jgi:hypothetical protein
MEALSIVAWRTHCNCDAKCRYAQAHLGLSGLSRGIKLDFPGLQAGKSIEVKDAKYKVRKIVPPDTDRQIRGWVELTPIRDGDGGAKDNRGQKN